MYPKKEYHKKLSEKRQTGSSYIVTIQTSRLSELLSLIRRKRDG